MARTVSRDGTAIAFDRLGEGQPLILVDGALCSRAFGPMPALAPLLARHFAVYLYDRRGRNESGDTPPYTADREIDDLQSMIDVAGGSAFVYGISSGAALALEAARRGVRIRKLALYEAPFIVDASRPPQPPDFVARLEQALRSNRRGDAVKLFLQLVGVPKIATMVMPLMPVWSKLKAVAHTLPYDITIVAPNQQGRPLQPAAYGSIAVPTLVLDGGKSPAWIRNGMRALAKILPSASYQTLPGQTHNVKASALAPALIEFFTASASDAHAVHAPRKVSTV
jgi:pimeloyl-ACP methyl ester carboxylesterase